LVKEYKKLFGFKKVLIRNIRINRLVVFYLLLSIFFPIVFVVFYIKKEFILMGASTVFYWILLYFGGEQHKSKMIEAKPKKTLAYNVQPFKNMLNEKFGIFTDDQFIRLDEVIKRENTLREYSGKYPFSDVIRQLVVALFTTGLLSFAFIEIREGNSDVGSKLLTVYLICIAVVAFVSGIIKQINDLGATYSLNEISFLIQLALLDNSVHTQPYEEGSYTDSNNNRNIISLPSRKNRKI
jgi:hypothetical protein